MERAARYQLVISQMPSAQLQLVLMSSLLRLHWAFDSDVLSRTKQ